MAPTRRRVARAFATNIEAGYKLVTMLPALIVAGAGLDVTRALVISQVVLSFGIPQALIGLAWLTGTSDVVGAFRNGAVIAALNLLLPATVLGL